MINGYWQDPKLFHRGYTVQYVGEWCEPWEYAEVQREYHRRLESLIMHMTDYSPFIAVHLDILTKFVEMNR